MTAHDRIGTFLVDESGYLVRCGRPRRGQEYEHRCELKTLEEVAHTIDEMAGAPFTYTDVHDRMVAASGEDWPWTQIAVVVAFLKERGIIVPVRGRKQVASATALVHEAYLKLIGPREVPCAGRAHFSPPRPRRCDASCWTTPRAVPASSTVAATQGARTPCRMICRRFALAFRASACDDGMCHHARSCRDAHSERPQRRPMRVGRRSAAAGL